MLITMTLSGLIVFGFVVASSFSSILFTILVFMFFQSSIISVCDANTYDLMDKHKEIQYGRIRLMGSAGYACTSLLMGAIIMFSNINVPFIAYFVYMAIGFIIVNTISVSNRRTSVAINLNSILSIIKNKKFLLISISALLANATFNANGNYIAVLIEKTGGDIANLGMLWFIVAISELPFFFFEAKIIKRFGVLNIYLVGMFIYIIRFLIDSYSTNYIIVLVAQILQGITFPLFLSATLRYVNDIVPSHARTTALTVFSAISGGIGGFLGNIAGGAMLQKISIFQLYRILALVCVLSLIIALGLKSKTKDIPVT
jgi:predicted MFS family arabinose efflux permease